MYEIIILPRAMKSLQSLDASIAERILDKLSWLAENFDDITPLPLKDPFSDIFKLRVGDWRVMYSYDNKKCIITVHLVGNRKDIYR